MMVVLLIAGLGLAVAGWFAVRTKGPLGVRLRIAVLPLSVAALTLMIVLSVLRHAISDEWTEAKLAAVIGMTRGFHLYESADSGVMTAWIYGPVGAFILLPSALAHDPTSAGIIGTSISSLFYFVPAGWLLWLASRGRNTSSAVAAFLVFAWQSVLWVDLSQCAFVGGCDGPAMGLAACACAIVYRRRSTTHLIVSAICMSLCIWTKQNFLPLACGLSLYIALADGWKTVRFMLPV